MSPLHLLTCAATSAADSTKVCLHSAAYSEAIRDVLSPLTSAVPRICGWVVLLLALYFVLKYVVAPLIANYHERKVKEENNTHEQEWSDKRISEREKALTAEIKKKISDLEWEIKLKDAEIELLNKRLSVYEKTMEKLNVEIKPREKNN